MGTAGNFVGPVLNGGGGGVVGAIETLQDDEALLFELWPNESPG